MTKDEITTTVEGLITIAKVAMPPDLFQQDPRIRKAKGLLVSLGGQGEIARPPNTNQPDMEQVLGPIIEVDHDASAIKLDWDLVDGVQHAKDDGLISGDDNALLNSIVRDWLISHGYLKPEPEDLT